MMNWYGNGISGWGFALMTINMVLFWGLLIAGIVVLVRYLGRQGSKAQPETSTPERILAERFAHGQIDEEEYRWRVDILRGHPKP